MRGVLLGFLCWIAQDSTVPLTPGLQLERRIGPGDRHVYIATLETGAAVLARVEQKGVDVVIDVTGPDGQRLAHLDNASGSQGSESIAITAVNAGTYRFAIHTANDSVPAGVYAIRVDRILGSADNARRLAKDTYPNPTVYKLWESSLSDSGAPARFVADRGAKGPLIEPIAGNSREMSVTYFRVGDAHTARMLLGGGPDFMGLEMKRIGRTDVFFGTQIVPKDARFVYAFNLFKRRRAGPNGEVELNDVVHSEDAVLEMPDAPRQAYIVPREGAPRGTLTVTTIASKFLGEDRKITVYTPPGYDGRTPARLLIVFDGGAYGAIPGQEASVPTPTILDNLITEKKIPATVGILVWSMGKRTRDLPGSKPFADFVATEVVHWARANYAIRPGAGSVVVAGSSLGGYAATFIAHSNPAQIGNVLSQSGSYWISRDWQKADGDFVHRLYPRETGTMIEAFRSSPKLPIRFYLEIGIYDLGAAMLGSNRELFEVLRSKGYSVDYREFAGGHSYENWRGSLADGLISLLGARSAR